MAALPYSELPTFMDKLNAERTVGADALRFTILTAARVGEAARAMWSEIDLERAIWTVPGERSKAARVHRVPLSKPALAILRIRHGMTNGQGLVFSRREDKRIRPSDQTRCGGCTEEFRSRCDGRGP